MKKLGIIYPEEFRKYFDNISKEFEAMKVRRPDWNTEMITFAASKFSVWPGFIKLIKNDKRAIIDVYSINI